MRSVLLSPGAGFPGALAIAERRARAGRRPAEGVAPLVLSSLGGAAVALLWLKVGALLGLREVCNPSYLAGYIVATAILGAVLALISQSVWGLIGPWSAAALRGDVPHRYEFRLVWGAAAFPQVFALFFLLPLDLLIVGPDTFTTTELVDPVSTAWAAFSIALGASALVWSLFLLFSGTSASTGLRGGRAVACASGAVLSVAVVLAALVAATLLIPQGAGCPT